jgi:transcriptional regulator with XRE-family HTH domain
MEKQEYYTQRQYAKLKGVSQQYISKLVKNRRLIEYFCPTKRRYLIVDCEQNDKIFKKDIKK